MATPALAVRSLRHRWPGATHDALAVEALQLVAGEQLFLHGPSGCGKSTLLSLAAGVRDAAQGSVEVDGVPWSSLRGARRDARRADLMGIVFQQFNLLPYLSAVDNVCLGCRFSARRQARARQEGGSVPAGARRWLQAMALPDELHDQAAGRLSVGQQQRVAAARALIGGPAVLLADEPTSALDEALKERFLDLLQSACRAGRSALVFVSHDRRLAGRFDRALSLPELGPA